MIRLKRAVAWLLLCGLMSVQGAVWLSARHAGFDDDVACAEADGSLYVGPHHQSGAQFENPVAPGPADHCVLCHVHHAFAHARIGASSLTPPARVEARACVRDLARSSVADLTARSPRGPPANLG